MNALRIILGAIFISIVVYTLMVGSQHGWNLLPVFFNDILAMNWPGQFNFDFLGFLLLSALWVSWRHHFSAGGLVLGVIAFFGGIMFLSIYLFVMSFSVDGQIEKLLLGDGRLKG